MTRYGSILSNDCWKNNNNVADMPVPTTTLPAEASSERIWALKPSITLSLCFYLNHERQVV